MGDNNPIRPLFTYLVRFQYSIVSLQRPSYLSSKSFGLIRQCVSFSVACSKQSATFSQAFIPLFSTTHCLIDSQVIFRNVIVYSFGPKFLIHFNGFHLSTKFLAVSIMFPKLNKLYNQLNNLLLVTKLSFSGVHFKYCHIFHLSNSAAKKLRAKNLATIRATLPSTVVPGVPQRKRHWRQRDDVSGPAAARRTVPRARPLASRPRHGRGHAGVLRGRTLPRRRREGPQREDALPDSLGRVGTRGDHYEIYWRA